MRSNRSERCEDTSERRKEKHPSKASSPSMTHTMRLVNESLSMPQQVDETSSAVNTCHRAFERSRKPPTVVNDNAMESRSNSNPQTPSGSGKVSLTSRVANQCYRNEAIKNGYPTSIPD
jgi:hypothetical protein